MASMARSLSIGSLWRCGQGSRLSGYGCQLPQEKTTIERKRAAANVASKDAAAAGTAVTCAAGAAGGLCCCLPAKSRRRGKQRRRGFNAVAASGQESKSTRLTVGRLLKLLLPDAHLLGTAFVFLVLAATCQALMPHFLSQTLGAIIDGQAAGNLRYVSFRRPLLSLLGAAMAGAFTASVRGACFIVLGARVSKRLRQRLFDSLVAQDIGFFDKTKGGEITSRLTQDCQRVADQVSYNVNIFSRTIVQLLVTLCFMLYYSRLLTAMSFATVPAIVLLSKTYGNFMQRLSEKTQQKLADANAAAQEALASMTTVRSFAGEEHERRRFGCRLQEYNALESRRAKFYVAYLTTTTALPQLGNCLIFCLIGYLCMHGMPAPSLLAFVFYLNSLNDGFGSVADVYTSIVQALGSSKRVFELIDRRPAGVIRVDSQQAELLEEGRGAGSMELAGVHFTYPARPGQPVLRGLNLVCPPGKVTALVGPSGGGKSTCIGLLKRLYEQDEGQVMLDGREVSSYSHKQFHEYVSIVGQEPELFACNVRENILYGLPATHPARQSSGESPGEEVLRAAKLANAHDFICKMPQGYATEVGGRGVQLSGGQKQRISIARALVRRPKVLLLDEATSALDAESEVLVQNAIDGLIAQHDMTVVVVAHRLSTVRRADKICVVSGGVVAEEGTHDELLSRPGGRYRQLVERQLGSVASGEDRLLEAVAAP